jgi:sodium/potassium-transporting ATPase subunit alpha
MDPADEKKGSASNSPELPQLGALPVAAEFDAPQQRTVAFPDVDPRTDREEKQPRGVELRQHMTLEEIQLAEAGYDHLQQEKTKASKEGALDKDVDIREHKVPLSDLAAEFKTSFEVKSPSGSYGLTADEAAARLKADGPNMLTPPKKKSALRKVCRVMYGSLCQFAKSAWNST